MRLDRRDAAFLVTVVLVASVAVLVRGLGDKRPETGDRSAKVIQVTSEADHGPGTLRQAIFAAARSPVRARLEIKVPKILIETPLPPLVNRHGISLRGREDSTVIDAAGMVGGGAVFEVLSPYSTFENLTVQGASGAAIVARAPGVRIERLRVRQSDIGIDIATGAAGFTLLDSVFEGNRIGLRLLVAEEGIEVQGVSFSDHTEAAVWAVRPTTDDRSRTTPISLHHNSFANDEIALVLGNMPAVVENNDIGFAVTAGIYLGGRGGTIRNNRIRSGQAVGLIAAGSESAVISHNEIDNNQTAGIILNSVAGTSVDHNQVHRNGFGMISVFGDAKRLSTIADNIFLGQREDGLVIVGGSPLIRGNRVESNGGAGLRLLDFLGLDGTLQRSTPLLEAGDYAGNGFDDPVRGTYREQRELP